MNLLANNHFQPISSESEEGNSDIKAFLSDIKSNKNNNQINIVKINSDEKLAMPVEMAKIKKSPIQEKNGGITINDCLSNKNSSIMKNQKSNCDFSDSDIEFSDFMFSDDDVQKEKNGKKINNQKNTKSINLNEPKQINNQEQIKDPIQTTEENPIKTEKVEDNINENDLDEFCIKDDEVNDQGIFELSDISNSDKKDETTNQASNKETSKIDSDQQDSIFNINASSNSNLINDLLFNNDQQDNEIHKDKSPNINIPKNNTQSNAKKEQNIKKNDKDNNNASSSNIKDKLQSEIKDDKEKNENKLFDKEIEIPKPAPKKTVKKRKNPTNGNKTKAPLNILDGLSFSFEDSKITKEDENVTKSNPKSTPTKPTNLSNDIFNISPIAEKIKIERVEKEKSPQIEQTTLPPLQPKPNIVYVKTGLENFEYSFISNLSYYLNDFRSTFLSQFQNQIRKCFEYDSLIKKFMEDFTRELNDEILKNSYCQDYVPASFSNVETELNSEFNQFSSFFSNSEKFDKGHFLEEDLFLPIDQVESIHSKFSNDCQFLLSQISKESQFLNNGYQDEMNSIEMMNSKGIEISELESKLIRIDAERDSIEYRLNYFKEKNSEIQEKVDFLIKLNDQDSKQSDFDNLLSDLKEFNVKKKIEVHFNENDFRSKVNEICAFCSQIASQFNLPQNFSNKQSFMQNSNFANTANMSMNLSMSNSSFQFAAFDSLNSFSQNGIVEDVRNRLFKARKMREDTIADLRSFEPNCNFAISGF